MRFAPQNFLGASFVHSLLSNGSATTLISAASNSRGMVIRHIAGQGQAGSHAALYIDTAAPASNFDTTKRRVALLFVVEKLVELPLPLFVPAGDGVFAWSDNTTQYLSIGYDLL